MKNKLLIFTILTLLSFFYIKDTSTEFPSHAYYGGEKDCSFEISYTSENDTEVVLWKHHAPPMREICGLSVSGVYRFEDAYFDKAETDVVIFNLLLHLLARYPTRFPDVDVVLTIGIVDVDSDAPKLVGINCKAFDLQLYTCDQRDIDYSEGVAKMLLDEINKQSK